MSQSYTNLLHHVIFSTKERQPLITSEHQPRLYEYIGGIIRSNGGISLGLNGTEWRVFRQPFKCSRGSRLHCRQKEHHSRVSFRDELIQFLEAKGIEYDERYL